VLEIHLSIPFLLLRFLFQNLLSFWCVSLYKWVSFLTRRLHYSSLVSVFNVLTIICYLEILFQSCLFGVLEAPYSWMDISFSRFGIFFYYFVKHVSYAFSLQLFSFFNVIYRFGLLMESQSFANSIFM
jgi:hypothetical protein